MLLGPQLADPPGGFSELMLPTVAEVPVTDFFLFTHRHTLQAFPMETLTNTPRLPVKATALMRIIARPGSVLAGCCLQATFPEPKTLNEILTW